MRTRIACSCVLFLLTSVLHAQVVHVPQDFPTIQLAIDATPDGGTVVVHAGTYEETIGISDRHDLTVRGAGQPVIEGGNAHINLYGGSGVVLRGLLFRDADEGVRVKGGSGHRVERCRFEQVEKPIELLEPSPDFVAQRNRMEDVFVGIAVDGGGCDAAPVRISRNRFLSTVIAVWIDGGPVVVEKNRIDVAFNRAIVVQAAGCGVVVARNRVLESLASVEVHAPATVVRQNRLEGPIVLSETATGSLIERNRIVTGEGHGVVVWANDTLVRDNVAVSGGEGYAAYRTGSVSIGVQLEDCRGRGETGFLIEGQQGRLTRCVAKDSLIGFDVPGTGNLLTACRAKDSAQYDLHDPTKGLNTYVDCVFSSSLFD